MNVVELQRALRQLRCSSIHVRSVGQPPLFLEARESVLARCRRYGLRRRTLQPTGRDPMSYLVEVIADVSGRLKFLLIVCVLLGVTACASEDDDIESTPIQRFKECWTASNGEVRCLFVGKCGQTKDPCTDPINMCTTVKITCDPAGTF